MKQFDSEENYNMIPKEYRLKKMVNYINKKNMEETFDIKFQSTTERFTIKIKTKDFDKFALALKDMCIEYKIDAEIVREEIIKSESL